MLTKRTDAILTTGVLLLGIGFILHIVGLATPAWMSYSRRRTGTFGLFKACAEGQCIEYIKTSSDQEAVQGLTITGAVLAGLAFIKSIIFSLIVYNGQTESKNLVKLAVFTGLETLLAALLIFVGCLLFAVDVYSESALGWEAYLLLRLDYSFFLCIVASGLIGVSGILVWIGTHRIIASVGPQPGLVTTPGGPVVYQASGSGAVYAPNYQPTESSVMQQNAGSTYPPPHQILPQQHSVYPSQQYAAYPPQQYAAYPSPQYAAPPQCAASPPQQFPATGSVAQPPNQPPTAEKDTT